MKSIQPVLTGELFFQLITLDYPPVDRERMSTWLQQMLAACVKTEVLGAYDGHDGRFTLVELKEQATVVVKIDLCRMLYVELAEKFIIEARTDKGLLADMDVILSPKPADDGSDGHAV